MKKDFIPNAILFGQYLLEKKKVDKETLEKAVRIQSNEDSSTLKESHRLLGQILLDDFSVFANRVELNKYIIHFAEFKAQMEKAMYEAQIYGAKRG